MFKGGMGNMMKQAQQMQERMQQAQEEIANMEVTGEAGARHGESDYAGQSQRETR